MSSGLTSGAPGRRAKRQRPRRTWGIWLIISIGVTLVVTGQWWSNSTDTETLAPENSRATVTPSMTVTEPSRTPSPSASTPAPTTPAPTTPAPVSRSATVSVFNNTKITGHAARTAQGARALGWKVSEVGNWRGSVPASTVYFPAPFEAEAKTLAQDLEIARVQPTAAGMSTRGLTVVLVS